MDLIDPIIIDGKAMAGIVHTVSIISVAGQGDKISAEEPWSIPAGQ